MMGQSMGGGGLFGGMGGGMMGAGAGMMGQGMMGLGGCGAASPMAGLGGLGMMGTAGGSLLRGGLGGLDGLQQLLGQAGNSLLLGRTSYGLGTDIPADKLPPKSRCPVDFIMPRAPARSKEKPLVFKALPSPSPTSTPGSRVRSRGKTPPKTFSLPPGSHEGSQHVPGGTPRLRPFDVLPPSSMGRPVTPTYQPCRSPSTPASGSGLRLRDLQPKDAHADRAAGPTRTPRSASPEAAAEVLQEQKAPECPVIKPNFIRVTAPSQAAPGYGRESELDDRDFGDEAEPIHRGAGLASPSFVPRLERADYWCKPSCDVLSKMSEAQLSRVESFEVGKYNIGWIRWEGCTDVRALDLDRTVEIEFGKLNMYPRGDKPPVGEGLNKKATVTLIVPPTREMQKQGLTVREISAQLAEITAAFGATFVSYDMERWVFRVDNFGKPPLTDKELRAEAKMKELALLLTPKGRALTELPTRR